MNKLKVLVVDDESRMRKLVKDFLVKQNYEVLEAGDGSEALDIFFENQDIALIILDVMMPRMDGWQVQEVRNYSKVPIIMLTARADERDESVRVSSWEWMSISPNRSAPRYWWRAWRRSCAGRTR